MRARKTEFTMITAFPKLSPSVKLDFSPGGGGSTGILASSAVVSGFMLDIALPKDNGSNYANNSCNEQTTSR